MFRTEILHLDGSRHGRSGGTGASARDRTGTGCGALGETGRGCCCCCPIARFAPPTMHSIKREQVKRDESFTMYSRSAAVGGGVVVVVVGRFETGCGQLNVGARFVDEVT